MKQTQPLNAFYWISIIVILLGIFFRLTNLDAKVYWHDEVFTSLHITGFTWREWNAQLFTGEIIKPEDLQYYLHINPQKTLADTLRTLAIDDPHHPPFYYILLRYWRQLFGDSIVVIRSFSAFASLLFFPAIYWLCWELLKTPTVGLLAVVLVSISPFYVLYAQEAREYALWTVLITLSSAALLRGIQLTKSLARSNHQSYLTWGLYSLLTTLSLYTSLFSLLVIIAHVFYTFLREKLRFTKVVFYQGIALIISVFLFIPWIIVFIQNYERYKTANAWTTQFKLPIVELLQIWGLNISRLFFDVGWELNNHFSYLIIILCFILVSYALYFLIKRTPVNVWLFIVSIMVTQLVLLLGPDLVFGGVRSLSPRYLIPFYIVTDIMVAYLLVSQLKSPTIFNVRIWSIITTIILSVGILSCLINSQKETAWTKVISYSLPEVARIINKTESPLLISNNNSYNPGNIFALSYLLDPDVKIQLFSNIENVTLPSDFPTVFIFSYSDQLSKTLNNSKQMTTNQVFGDIHLGLWKVEFNDQSSN